MKGTFGKYLALVLAFGFSLTSRGTFSLLETNNNTNEHENDKREPNSSETTSPEPTISNITKDPPNYHLGEVSEEKRLLALLQTRYTKYGNEGRPVKNSSTSVRVEFGLGLIKMELMEKENMLSISTWTRFKWRDEYLTWDPAEYGGVYSVKLSHRNIWIPDIMLYNTANTDESSRTALAVLAFDGTVTWFPHKVFHSSCAVDVRNFPFDNQTCHLWFGSWTHEMKELDLHLAFPGGIDLTTFKSVYKDASEWSIINSTAERMIIPPEGEGQYAILTFTLHLKRKMMFSTYILTMPAIFLSFLTLLVFWLPPEHADKSALGLTIFGSLLLLLLILVEAAPPTASAVPLLGVYYCFTTVIVILSIFLSSLVMKVGGKGQKRKPAPRWVRVIILGILSRLVCLRLPGCFFRYGRCHHDDKETSSNQVDYTQKDDLDRELMEMCEPSVIVRDLYEDTTRYNGSANSTSSIFILDSRLRALQALLQEMLHRQTQKEQNIKQEYEIMIQWRNVAAVLDRLFFIGYLVVIIISLVLLFPRSLDEGASDDW